MGKSGLMFQEMRHEAAYEAPDDGAVYRQRYLCK